MNNNSFAHLTEHYRELEDISSDFRNTNLNSLIAKKIEKGSVLDVGCGAGHLLSLLKKKGCEVRGIEPNTDLIALGNTLYGSLNIEPVYAENIPEKLQVDTITAIDVLEHIDDDLYQLKLFNRALASNGNLILVVPAYPSFFGKRDQAMGHFRRYTRRELNEKLSSAGFAIRYIRSWNALGVLPYFISEKIFHNSLDTSLRQQKKGVLHRIANSILGFWFRIIENTISFGFGLSIICIAQKS